MADLDEDNVDEIPSILLPCVSCNRTFRPEALAKHAKVCEKTLKKKRKVFDSSKQRIQGTELAEFLPVLPTFTKKPEKSPVRKIQAQSSNSSLSSSSKTSLSSPKSKWREKHNELVKTIQAARLPPGQAPPAPVKLSGQEQCPYCDRSFGPKAYDRHLEWCKEQRTRIQPKSPASQRAKERLQARTQYQAPLTNKCRQKRSGSRDKLRDPSPSQHPHTNPPHTPTMTRRKTIPTAAADVVSSPCLNTFVKGTPLRSSTRSTRSSVSLPNKKPQLVRSNSEPEPYDPFKSAERQMLELLELDKDPPKLAPIAKSPAILSSPTSAFTKFSSIHTPEPLFISEDDNRKSNHYSEKSDSPLTVTSPCDNYPSSNDSNQNPISLSTLSLCSTISIESIDGNRNSYRYATSAKVPEKKTPVPVRRTASALESRRPRDPFKGMLKMEDMLYGSANPEGERYFGSPLITGNLNKDSDNQSSNGSLYKAVSDAETLNAEQELLKSMSEFEKLLSSSSSSPSPSSPSLKLFPSLGSSFGVEEPSKPVDLDFHSVIHTTGPDSAYSSLNRKSPVGGEQERGGQDGEVARFCHECGAKYPLIAAKFCCQCGVRRLVI